ncbi:uncharacterized protein N0V89_007532 [Didymosphaeria variabile]|uniref:Uncharacterized protein n=1 Tax=Didymosphaeria variabile TaxID=1932322 RepID=A0A9W8XIZ9_9PLEO|nr:uncharacterized protein N0V89_007532 [Didymosphaeria variabile]KAJ4352185.1 hypothetical protein N0V89_007532 [Didymosphaeria variabile]
MSEQETRYTIKHTANMLKFVKYPEIQLRYLTNSQKKYLAQVYNIGTDLSKDIYHGLTKPAFDFSEVEELSKTAQEWYKEKRFRPAPGERLTGFPPSMPIYNY